MKFLLSLFLVVFVSVNASSKLWQQMTDVDFSDSAFIDKAFEQWKVAFDKNYATGEETKKLNFIRNWQKVVAHNELPKGNWTERLNQFADLTHYGFKMWVREHGHLLFPSTRGRNHWEPPEPVPITNDPVPNEVNWVTKGVVTPVKNQGQCGSCWTFATTGSIECRYAIKTGHLNSLSEQQIVDCDRQHGNDGCNGGWPYYAMEYVHKQGGLCTESEYPYQGVNGQCQQSSCGTKYDDISSQAYVTPGSTMALEQAIVKGCVAVLVDADWQNYNSGVYTAPCGTSLDHAVLAVGYGSMGGSDYWRIKNSWGESWGDNGYILLCRNCGHSSTGECGVLKQPSYPIV